jgi:hypothetical protein
MHGLGTIIRMNMSKEEIDEAARRSAAAKPNTVIETEKGGGASAEPVGVDRSI